MPAIYVSDASTVTTGPGTTSGYFPVADNSSFLYPGAIVWIAKADGSLPKRAVIIDFKSPETTTDIGLHLLATDVGAPSPVYTRSDLSAYNTGSSINLEGQVVMVSDVRVGRLLAGDNITLSPPDGIGDVTVTAGDDPAVGYDTVQFPPATPLTQRTKLSFSAAGFSVADNAGGTRTDVDLAAVGPGAGAIGSSAKLIRSVTLDVKGRVTAATAVDLGALATGLLKNTTTTGGLSIATADTDYQVPLTFGSGLTRTVNAVANDLITGKSGGQTIIGDTASAGTLTIKATSHATPGVISVTATTISLAMSGAGITPGISATTSTAGESSYLETGVVAGNGDAAVRFSNTGGTAYYLGLDNSVANDPLIIGQGAAVGTNPMVTMTMPSTNVIVDFAGTSASIKVGGTQIIAGGGGSQVILGTDNTKSLTFVTNGSAFMQINGTTGNVLLGGGGTLPTDVASTTFNVKSTPTVASATSAVWDGINFTASTVVVSGVANVTTATGFNYFVVGRPTISNASITVTNAATVYIANSPTTSGGAAITNAYSLWVDDGVTRLDGNVQIGVPTTPATTHALTINDNVNSFTAFSIYNGNASASNRNWTILTNNLAFGDFAIRTSTAKDGNPISTGSIRMTIASTGAVGFPGTSTPVAQLEVITASDTTNGGPAAYDTKFLTVGVGGGTGGGFFISYNQSSNAAFIGALAPSVAFRDLNIQKATSGTSVVQIGSTFVQTGIGVAGVQNAALTVGGNRTVASASGATWDTFSVLAATLTLSGSTNVTTATGLNFANFGTPTYSNSTITVTHAATVYIAAAPAASGGMTITNAYALWIDSGKVRWDGAVALGAGGTATLGTVGGSGPATTTQNQWLPVNIDGNARFIPVWA